MRLSKFENERVITFIPPDGDFELVSYRLDMNVNTLFNIDVRIIRKGTTKITYNVKIRSNFKAKSTANDVFIYIPTPDDAK